MSQNNWSNKFATFAVGAGVGALLALLFAPSSGEETRDYLSGTLKKGLNDAASTGKRWTRRAQDKVEDVKVNVAGAVEAGGKAYRTARDA
jgi:gas vesicle protein